MTDLLPQHLALLHQSAISAEVAAARGYRSVTTKAELGRLGFSPSQQRVPTLVIPVRGVTGEVVTYQSRPDEPRITKGKVVKYETPRGSRMAVDVPSACLGDVGDPQKPLFITEAPRKADAAVSKGLTCISIIGVWNWRGTNGSGGKTALPDWESIALDGRDVTLAFDSDAATKPEVWLALSRLREFLRLRGAQVRIARLPSGPGGVKTGLDDYFAEGHSVDDLLSVSGPDLPPKPPDDRPEFPYRSDDRGLYHLRPSEGDVGEIRLTNFDARIVADIVEDDGIELRHVFEIEATLGDRMATTRVPARRFNTMQWVSEWLGAAAVVFPHRVDHARTAIQLLSGAPPTHVVFTSMGWREVDGEQVYLHGGGAIGPNGTVLGVRVRLEEPLTRFVLPDPPDPDDLREAVRASLDLLDVAEDHVSFPLVGGAFRAPLGDTDHSIHLTGPTGVFKTELAALVQSHYGAGLDSRHLPGAWSSTENANEDLLFRAKDAVCVIDDFAPGGSMHDVSRANREADRVLRAQGNASSRQRMRADGSLRSPRPPRGLTISTGEDTPRGASLRARMIIIEIGQGDVVVDTLTRCQADARDGRYASAMSGFIRWLAGLGAQGRKDLRSLDEGAADVVSGDHHRRTPRNLLSLACGLNAFLTFAEEVGVIGADERQRLRERGLAAFRIVGGLQTADQVSEDPVRRYVEFICSAISSGKAHVAAVDGEPPPRTYMWGWRRDQHNSGHDAWRPQGTRVGWVDGDDLYLDPHASYGTAQSVGKEAGDPISLQPRTLHKRLNSAGLLLSTEHHRGHLTVRRKLEGARRAVLHLSTSSLGVAQSAHAANLEDGHGQDGSETWDGSARKDARDGPARHREAAHNEINGRRPPCAADPDLYRQHIPNYARLAGTDNDWTCALCDDDGAAGPPLWEGWEPEGSSADA